MLEPWQDALQDIKKDVRLLIYLAIVIILLASVILVAFLGWVMYYLLVLQTKLRLGYLARQTESHSVENIPNSVAAPQHTMQQQPSEEIKKIPKRPVTRDLVEVLAERAVKTGRWQSLSASTQSTEEIPMKPMSFNRVRKVGFTRTRSVPSEMEEPHYTISPVQSLEGQQKRGQRSPTDGTKLTKF